MIRTLTALGVLALTSAASVPASAEDVRVTLSGKTPAAAYAAISDAARTVCRNSVADSLYALYLESACRTETIADTLAKVGDPALVNYARTQRVPLKIASN